MSKAIYALTVWMFWRQFKITAREENGLWQIAVLIFRLYTKAWTLAPEAAAAPRHDLRPAAAEGFDGLRGRQESCR